MRTKITIFTLTIGLAATPLLGQSIFSDNGETAWKQYHAQLDHYLGGTQPPAHLQPLAVSQRVEWDSKSSEYNLFLKQDVGNQIPNWTALYTRSFSSVSDAYQSFLDRLNANLIQGSAFPNKDKLNALDNQRIDLVKKLDKLRTESNSEWLKYTKKTSLSLQLTRPKWEEDEGYAGARANYQKQLQAVEGAYMVEVNTAAGPDLQEVGRAITAMGNQTQQLPLPSTSELSQMDKENWEYFYRTFLDGDIFQFKADHAPATFTIKQGETETTTMFSAWNAHASVSWCCFFNASGGVEDVQKSKQFVDATSEITVNFQNIKPFNIIRGKWFQGNLVNKFINRLDPNFWGPAGGLNQIPQTLILAQGLSVEITTSKEMSDYVYHRHTTSGGGGFSIGPFGFGGGGSHTTEYEHTLLTQTATGLKIEDTSGRATILAVISNRPADLLQTPPHFSVPFDLPLSVAPLNATPHNASSASLAAKKAYEEALSGANEPPLSMELRPQQR